MTFLLAVWLVLLLAAAGITYHWRESLHSFWHRWEFFAASASCTFYAIVAVFHHQETLAGRLRSGAVFICRHILPALLFAGVGVSVWLDDAQDVRAPLLRLSLTFVAFVSLLLGQLIVWVTLNPERNNGRDTQLWRELLHVDVPFTVSYGALLLYYVSIGRPAVSEMTAFIGGASAFEVLVRSTIHSIQVSRIENPRPAEQRRYAILVAGVPIVLGAAAALLAMKVPPSPAPSRPPDRPVPSWHNIAMPPNSTLGSIYVSDMGVPHALSPDGGAIAFVASLGGQSRIYVRRLSERTLISLPDGEGGLQPFFSPDGRRLGFFKDSRMRVVTIGESDVTPLDASAPSPRGASWASDGTILYAPRSAGSGLFRLKIGGTPEEITQLQADETSHRWPQAIGSADAVLFSTMTRSGRENERSIAIATLDGSRRHRVLIRGATFARYVTSGHLVFARSGGLYARPFDLQRREFVGDERPVLNAIQMSPDDTGVALFDIASNGTLAYVPGHSAVTERSLVWVDWDGAVQKLSKADRRYVHPRLSPNNLRVAVTVEGPSDDVWLLDLRRRAEGRLTFGGGDQWNPLFTPDSKSVVFTSNREGSFGLFQMSAELTDDESAPMQQIGPTQNLLWTIPCAFTRDGKELVVAEQDPQHGWNVGFLDVQQKRMTAFMMSAANETYATLSPDGQWLAYVSIQSGSMSVYVRARLNPSRNFKVAPAGGAEPVWAPTGGYLFYRDGRRMMRVAVRASSTTFSAGRPELLFEDDFLGGRNGVPNYDVSRDSRRFLMVRGDPAGDSLAWVDLVPHWTSQLSAQDQIGSVH